jgi:hypothetical protein
MCCLLQRSAKQKFVTDLLAYQSAAGATNDRATSTRSSKSDFLIRFCASTGHAQRSTVKFVMPEAACKPITVEDAMIAATARAYGVEGIATRNTKDFVGCGVELINLWGMDAECWLWRDCCRPTPQPCATTARAVMTIPPR